MSMNDGFLQQEYAFSNGITLTVTSNTIPVEVVGPEPYPRPKNVNGAKKHKKPKLRVIEGGKT